MIGVRLSSCKSSHRARRRPESCTRWSFAQAHGCPRRDRPVSSAAADAPDDSVTASDDCAGRDHVHTLFNPRCGDSRIVAV